MYIGHQSSSLEELVSAAAGTVYIEVFLLAYIEVLHIYRLYV